MAHAHEKRIIELQKEESFHAQKEEDSVRRASKEIAEANKQHAQKEEAARECAREQQAEDLLRQQRQIEDVTTHKDKYYLAQAQTETGWHPCNSVLHHKP